jgi:hypothetical protein
VFYYGVITKKYIVLGVAPFGEVFSMEYRSFLAYTLMPFVGIGNAT